MSEQLAIIRNLHIGVGDRGLPAIWFDTYINESNAALQVIYGARDMWDFINDSGASDLLSLNGKSCFVEVDSTFIKFLRLAKI